MAKKKKSPKTKQKRKPTNVERIFICHKSLIALLFKKDTVRKSYKQIIFPQKKKKRKKMAFNK